MRGAIIGDVIGSRYEFNRSPKTKEFPLFDSNCCYTDDSAMTVAVADTIMAVGKNASEDEFKTMLISKFKEWGHRYPTFGSGGYGCKFYQWLFSDATEPYGSFGNGSAMRVAPVGWAYDTLLETRKVARWSAEVTHNHPEGVKGAEVVAAVIFLMRKDYSKAWIRSYISSTFGYDLSRTCDEIRPGYTHIETCQQTVPEALTAFLEGKDFEDVIRNAVSLGGDCDTLTDIACAMAEGCYPIPDGIWETCETFLPDDFKDIVSRFRKFVEVEK